MLFSMMNQEPAPAPDAVKAKATWWHALVVILAMDAVLQLVALEFFSCLTSVILTALAYWMVRNDMRTLPNYVVAFSILAVVELVLSLLTLIPSVFGRSSTTTSVVSSEGGTTTYEMTKATTPFFDLAMGVEYNLQSFSYLFASVATLFATILSVWSCLKVQAEAPEDDAETGWLGAGARQQAAGEQSSGGGSVVNRGVQRQKPQQNFHTFSGQGQSLGSK